MIAKIQEKRTSNSSEIPIPKKEKPKRKPKKSKVSKKLPRQKKKVVFDVQEVKIEDTTNEVFLAFLQYIYSAHCPIPESDSVGILMLADRYVLSRLVTLCELYISKAVEKATAETVSKAQIDVIDLLQTAQMHNAPQLAKFCLHFLCTNYQIMKNRAEYKNLSSENRTHVEDNQWPPVSYLKQLEEYEKSTGKKRSDDKCSIM